MIEIDPADRGDPVDACWRDTRRRSARPRRLSAARSWSSTCGGRVPAVPQRDARCWWTPPTSCPATRRSSASTSATSSTDNARAFVRGLGVPFPSIYDPGSELLLSFPSPFNPRDIPSTVVLDRQGRVAALIRGEIPSKLTLLDAGRGRRRPRMGDWFQQTAFSGSMVARDPGRRPRRAGVLLLAVRDAAAARLPLLHDRALRRRPRRLRGRTRAAAGCSPASSLFVLGFSVVFVGLGVLSASVSRWFFVNSRTLDDRARRARDRARAGLHGTGAAVPARRAGAQGAGRRTGRGADARLPLRSGLDALHRPDAGRHPRRWRLREPGRAAASCSRSTRSGSASRSSLAALAWRRALGAFAFVRRHQQWVTRIGGLMLILIGRAAAHRLVGPGGPLGADPPRHRLRGERVITPRKRLGERAARGALALPQGPRRA